MNTSPPTVYSVDALTSEIKKLLEMSYVDVWVEGEVSQLAAPPSGHLYFTLKDQGSVLKCVLFKNKKYLCTSLPAEGERILVRGGVSIYTARGDVQLICRYVEAAGEGELRRRFEALKNQLRSEGLFDELCKRPLPPRPRTIGLITSSHGAVLHDIISTLSRRYPFVTLKLFPATVQGENAAGEIIEALRLAELEAPELIILARGGGSLEDLQAFNDESVARAVAACNIPLVSAIGHETDFVITDFVADRRAPTPTAAATLATPDIAETRTLLQQQESALLRTLQQKLNTLQQGLDFAAQRLKHPRERLALQGSEIQRLILRLQAARRSHLEGRRNEVDALAARLVSHSPELRLSRQGHALEQLERGLQQQMRERLNREQTRLQQLITALQAFSPLQTLARGYSIMQNADGEIVRQADQVSGGERLQAQLHRGKLSLTVDKSE